MPTLSNHTQLPRFRYTGPVATHVNWHGFVMEPRPVHLRVEDYLDDYDPWSDDDLPSYEEVTHGR